MRQEFDTNRLRETKRRMEQLLNYYRETVGEDAFAFRFIEERLEGVALRLQGLSPRSCR